MVVPALGASVVIAGLQSKGGPLFTGVRAPTGPTSKEFAALFKDVQALADRGLDPLLFTDPFTGGLTLATADQGPVIFGILEERFARQEQAGQLEPLAVRRQRQALLEQRRNPSPVFPITTTEVPVTADPVIDQAREQVILSLIATSPKVVAPGVVSSRTAKSTRPQSRLGGPCAGITTGFQRVTCARGGFT